MTGGTSSSPTSQPQESSWNPPLPPGWLHPRPLGFGGSGGQHGSLTRAPNRLTPQWGQFNTSLGRSCRTDSNLRILLPTIWAAPPRRPSRRRRKRTRVPKVGTTPAHAHCPACPEAVTLFVYASSLRRGPSTEASWAKVRRRPFLAAPFCELSPRPLCGSPLLTNTQHVHMAAKVLACLLACCACQEWLCERLPCQGVPLLS